MKLKYRFTDKIDMIACCEQLASDGVPFSFRIRGTNKFVLIDGYVCPSTAKWLNKLVYNKLATLQVVKK